MSRPYNDYTFMVEVPLKGSLTNECTRMYSRAKWKHFQELIQRGANLWPDAPPEIKEFADLVTNGTVMQDYYRQANKEQGQTK